MKNDSNSNFSSEMKFKSIGNNITKNREKIDMRNKSARYVNVSFIHSGDKGTGGIVNTVVFGKDNTTGACKKITIQKVFNFEWLEFNNFDTIGSYQKLIPELKTISKYRSEINDLNDFTKLFSPNKYTARFLDLKANY